MFLICIAILCVSFLQKGSYKSVDDIENTTLQTPIQTEADWIPIVFERDGYTYTLHPLYNYTLNGLVVSALQYDTWYSMSRVTKTFTKDVCIIWWDTVAKRGYQEKSLSIKQDFRFCLYRYFTNNITFNGNELSNNHLIPKNSEVEKKILTIESGDQVKIIGKLVNVRALATWKLQKYENNNLSWDTSITRDDTWAGACEVIYVEDVEVLKKGNQVYHILFSLSLWGTILLLIYKIVELSLSFRSRKTRT